MNGSPDVNYGREFWDMCLRTETLVNLVQQLTNESCKMTSMVKDIEVNLR